jgi:hypothetical protein
MERRKDGSGDEENPYINKIFQVYCVIFFLILFDRTTFFRAIFVTSIKNCSYQTLLSSVCGS